MWFEGLTGFREESPKQVRELIADVQQLHIKKTNAGSLFQVASQFNLLEMVSPNVTPEQGVGRYENDRTQGPACAIAAGGEQYIGTILWMSMENQASHITIK